MLLMSERSATALIFLCYGGWLRGGVGGEILHALEINLKEGGKCQVDRNEVIEERLLMDYDIAIDDRQDAVSDGRSDDLKIEVRHILKNQM